MDKATHGRFKLGSFIDSALVDNVDIKNISVSRPGDVVEFVNTSDVPIRPVTPVRCFHGRTVPMISGLARTTDIKLWGENDRLEVFLRQFEKEHGRKPDSNEILDIMLNKLVMPGLQKKDQFKIPELARNIAWNGVTEPPIIDVDGTLLDGNRRLAACYYVLAGTKFTPEEKKRASTIFVYQLTEHANAEDRKAVMVALNFAPDLKIPWPKYVRAQQVHQAYTNMLELHPRANRSQKQQLIGKVAEEYAITSSDVTVYLRMIELAYDFEDYHINKSDDPNRTEECPDIHEIRHRVSEEIEYFDELSKTPIKSTLQDDEEFKGLVFDLLYQDKFKNFTLIRSLKHHKTNNEIKQKLQRALDLGTEGKELEEAQDLVEDVLTEAARISRESRQASPNTRIEAFCDFLENAGTKTFHEQVTTENCNRLLNALKWVEPTVQAVIVERRSIPNLT